MSIWVVEDFTSISSLLASSTCRICPLSSSPAASPSSARWRSLATLLSTALSTSTYCSTRLTRKSSQHRIWNSSTFLSWMRAIFWTEATLASLQGSFRVAVLGPERTFAVPGKFVQLGSDQGQELHLQQNCEIKHLQQQVNYNQCMGSGWHSLGHPPVFIKQCLNYNVIFQTNRNIFSSNMHQVTLQSYPYRNYHERCARQGRWDDLKQLIENAMSNPQVLNDSFKLNLYRFSDKTTHNVDLDFATRFFDQETTASLGISDLLLGTLGRFLNTVLPQTTQYDRYLRAYFIVLLNPHIYDPAHTALLTRLSIVLAGLSAECRGTLIQWLCDVDQERLRVTVRTLQQSLSKLVTSLLPGHEVENMDYRAVTGEIVGVCRLLELFFLSNEVLQRLPQEDFKNKEVMAHFDPSEQYKLHYKGIKILNFMMFPFLLSIDYKNKLLEIESKVEHQINMQRGLMNMINGIIPEENKLNNTVVNAIFFMLKVNRGNILDDSIDKLAQTKANLKNPLKITFIGEPGDDGGGVKKEYFQLVVKEIFNPERDLFMTKNNRYHWFNGETFEAPIMFEFVGMLLGLSIYNTTLLELKFPKVLYKKLMLPATRNLDALEELGEIEPDFQKSFKYILQTQQDLSHLELCFQAETEVFGTKVRHPLKPHGEMIKLTQANKHDYVSLYANWLIHKSVEKQFEAFRRGFYKVVTGDVIKLFSPEELERVICGSETLDFKDLERAVKYEGGFTPSSPVVQNLWELLHSADLAFKKAFLFFVTGSDRAPIRGLSSLKMVIQWQPDSENLPSSHTCAGVLLLPEYQTKEKLKEKVELALQFKESFGMI